LVSNEKMQIACQRQSEDLAHLRFQLTQALHHRNALGRSALALQVGDLVSLLYKPNIMKLKPELLKSICQISNGIPQTSA